jgi:hypothetical protein
MIYMNRVIYITITIMMVFGPPIQSAGRAYFNPPDTTGADKVVYLDNGFVKVGIDLDLGGSITYLADARKGENMINNADWGRQIQMSFYSGPVPFVPHGKKPSPVWKGLGWNPIQSGDYAGNRSKVISYKNNGQDIYVKSIPMQWPLDSVPCECTFESWIHLEGNTVHVRSRINNNRKDATQYPGRMQELPAVYTNGNYNHLVTYRGRHPFTGDSVSFIKNENIPGAGSISWDHWQATENWAASLNAQGWGLGVWNPGVQQFSGGFYGHKNALSVGSKDASTCYIAPNYREILDHNINYEYHYVLILGTLKQIRGYIFDHVKQQDRFPSYTFTHDRQHWIYRHTTDTGWPIRGYIKVWLHRDAALIGPPTFWEAKKASYLYMRAAYHTHAANGRIYWRTFTDNAYTPQQSIEFKIRKGGAFHLYKISLKDSDFYKKDISGLEIVPAEGNIQKGDWVEIKSIKLGR